MKSVRSKPVPPNHHGFALLIVLWIIALISVLTVSFNYSTRTEILSIAQQHHSAEALARAEAGIWLAAGELLKPVSERKITSDGREAILPFENEELNVRIYDLAGKIDLNTANQALLSGLINSAQHEDIDGDALSQAIMDWRDKDNLARINGAEERDYEAAELDYSPKNGDFNSVDELRSVLGMNENLFRYLKPALTVHSRLPGINPRVAAREALLALPNTDEEIVDEFILARQEGNNTLPAGWTKDYLSNGGSRSFEIKSTARAGKSTVMITTVILLKRKAASPFSVLSWRQSTAEKQVEETAEAS